MDERIKQSVEKSAEKLLSHMGTFKQESLERMAEAHIENLEALCAGVKANPTEYIQYYRDLIKPMYEK